MAITTPILDFVRAYSASDPVRLHMPGHKGASVLGVEHLDITEIEGADVLYDAHGIIRESRENAARLFGSGQTLYSTEGSSLCIRAMLMLALTWGREQGRTPRILAGRNAHRVLVGAAALLGAEVEWLMPEEGDGLLSCTVSAEGLARRLDELAEPPVAVYVTSPDYLGNRLDLAALAAVCHAREILLLVDNAHGAYLRFLPRSMHPMDLGADACCDSAHKTLPALTGTAYLHLSATAPALLHEQAERAMALFASTSPSYLLLQSLDALNAYLAEGYRERLAAFVCGVDALKERLRARGIPTVGDEPLKLTLCPKAYGYRGTELAEALRGRGIVCEMADPDVTVLMLTPEGGEAVLTAPEEALCALPRRAPLCEPMPTVPHAERVMPLRSAMLSAGRLLPVAEAEGCVLADATYSCPPAVPILVAGERICREAIDCFTYYGITHCRVVSD